MKEQTPTWAIIVGILMMLIGGCGIKNDIQSINIRDIIAMKDKVLDNIVSESKDSLSKDTGELKQNIQNPDLPADTLISENSVSADVDSVDSDVPQDSLTDKNSGKMFGDIFNVPEKTIIWTIRLGYVGLVFSFLYIIGGLFLFIRKTFSLKLAYVALGANMVFNIFKWIVMSGQDAGLLKMASSVGSAFSLFTCIILLIIIISSDKAYFLDQAEI